MSIDNTHTKYLKGSDKVTWKNYIDASKAYNSIENFLGGESSK